jgi:hypothetical protein
MTLFHSHKHPSCPNHLSLPNHPRSASPPAQPRKILFHSNKCPSRPRYPNLPNHPRSAPPPAQTRKLGLHNNIAPIMTTCLCHISGSGNNNNNHYPRLTLRPRPRLTVRPRPRLRRSVTSLRRSTVVMQRGLLMLLSMRALSITTVTSPNMVCKCTVFVALPFRVSTWCRYHQVPSLVFALQGCA